MLIVLALIFVFVVIIGLVAAVSPPFAGGMAVMAIFALVLSIVRMPRT